MIIIPRAAWGARYPAGFGPAPMATELWLHHTVTIAPDLVPPFTDDDAAIRELERIGHERFGGGISYTFLVTPVGRVYEGTGGLRMGAHTAGRNSRARAIALVGDYSRTRPTEAQVDAVAALVHYGRAVGWWTVDRLSGGHRDAPKASTECPGAAAWTVIPVINSRATTAHLDDLEDDMTPEQDERLERLETGVTLLLQQMIGPGATITQPWPGPARGGGWEHWRWNYSGPDERLTLVDLLRAVDRKLNSGMTLDGRPNHPDALDDAWGHGLSAHAHAVDVHALVEEVARRVGVPEEVIAQVSTEGNQG